MILNRQRTVRVARPPLESFLHRVRQQLGLNGAEVTICLVSDTQIARMNESFRKKKGPTDVLSFPAITRRRPHPVRLQPAPVTKRAVVAAAFRSGRFLSLASTTNAVRNGIREGTSSVHLEERRGVPKRPNKQGALAPEANFLGDIAISPATARRNARKFRRTLPKELQILILHGVLHLLGYDHETDRGQMTRIENLLRRKLGLA
jgi:rRNA maturation RNase YbeY